MICPRVPVLKCPSILCRINGQAQVHAIDALKNLDFWIVLKSVAPLLCSPFIGEAEFLSERDISPAWTGVLSCCSSPWVIITSRYIVSENYNSIWFVTNEFWNYSKVYGRQYCLFQYRDLFSANLQVKTYTQSFRFRSLALDNSCYYPVANEDACVIKPNKFTLELLIYPQHDKANRGVAISCARHTVQ